MTTTTSNDLVHYLIERGLLTPSSVVDGDLLVTAGARRNGNFTIRRTDGVPYFVKCALAQSPGSADTLRREAGYYQWAAAHPALTGMRALLPRFFLYDPQRSLLVIEFFEQGHNVTEFHRRANGFPEDVARLLGRALAQYHASTAAAFAAASAPGSGFGGNPPWILSLHHSHSQFGQAGTQLATILQSYPDYTRALDSLRHLWRPNALIHGDMKFDNCLVVPESDGTLGVRVVDWELADVGEDTWDAGAMIQSYLTACVMSLQPGGQMTITVEQVQPAMRAFWESYAHHLRIPEPEREARLERCFAYAGARMLQTALETLHFSPTMTAHVALVLQMSLNILRDPRAAVREFAGIERGIERAAYV